MAEKKNIEVIVGEKADKQGEGGKDSSAPQSSGSEVGGRSAQGRMVQCPHCGSIRYIVEETTRYQYYTCGNCGGTYYF